MGERAGRSLCERSAQCPPLFIQNGGGRLSPCRLPQSRRPASRQGRRLTWRPIRHAETTLIKACRSTRMKPSASIMSGRRRRIDRHQMADRPAASGLTMLPVCCWRLSDYWSSDRDIHASCRTGFRVISTSLANGLRELRTAREIPSPATADRAKHQSA